MIESGRDGDIDEICLGKLNFYEHPTSLGAGCEPCWSNFNKRAGLEKRFKLIISMSTYRLEIMFLEQGAELDSG